MPKLEKLNFVVPGVLAGCKYPDGEAAITEVATRGFKTLVNLTETSHPLANTLYEKFGVEAVHIPISDFSPPTLQQLVTFSELVRDKTRWPVLVHCHLGAGRTGTMLSVGIAILWYSAGHFPQEFGDKLRNEPELRAQQITARDVLDYHRRMRPESIMTTRQQRFFTDLIDSGKAMHQLVPTEEDETSRDGGGRRKGDSVALKSKQ